MLTNLFSQSTLELKKSATNEGQFRRENGLDREYEGTTYIHFVNGARPSKLENPEIDTLNHDGTKQIQFITQQNFEKARAKVGSQKFLKEDYHLESANKIRQHSMAYITWDSLDSIWDMVDEEDTKTLAYVDNLKTDPENSNGLKPGTEQGGYMYINGNDYPAEIKFWSCPDKPKGKVCSECGCYKTETSISYLPQKQLYDKIRSDLGPNYEIIGFWHIHPTYRSTFAAGHEAGSRRSKSSVTNPSNGDYAYFRDAEGELKRLSGGPAIIVHKYGVTIFRSDGHYPTDKQAKQDPDNGYREIMI